MWSGGEVPAPGHWPPDPAAPRGRTKRSGRIGALVIAGCGGLLLLLMCGAALFGITNELSKDVVPDDQLQAGTCVLVKGSTDRPELWHADCSDAQAYRIIARLDGATKTDGCPPGTDRTYQQFSVGSGQRTFVLCLHKA
jgi:hypothetical protein